VDGAEGRTLNPTTFFPSRCNGTQVPWRSPRPSLHQEGVHDVKESGTVEGSMERAWGKPESHAGRRRPYLAGNCREGRSLPAVKALYRRARQLPALPGAAVAGHAKHAYPIVAGLIFAGERDGGNSGSRFSLCGAACPATGCPFFCLDAGR